jgi:hypothetical protein
MFGMIIIMMVNSLAVAGGDLRDSNILPKTRRLWAGISAFDDEGIVASVNLTVL